MRTSLYALVDAAMAMPLGTRINATTTGTTIDRIGANPRKAYQSVGFAIITGTVTDGTHTFSIEHSDNGSAWSAAPAEDVLGNAPVVTASNDDAVYDVTYVGLKRYVRVKCVGTGATTGATFGAVALLHGPRHLPVIQG